MEMEIHDAVIDSKTGREIIISRLINSSPGKVFDAFTDPEKVIKWWGPNGFTNTNIEMDVTPGGVWRFIMHGPDGRDYLNKVVFTEVIRPELLVYRHSGEGETADVNFHVSVVFEEINGGTLLTMKSVFDSEETLQKVVQEHGALEGATQNMNRLEEFLKMI